MMGWSQQAGVSVQHPGSERRQQLSLAEVESARSVSVSTGGGGSQAEEPGDPPWWAVEKKEGRERERAAMANEWHNHYFLVS
jgi:hypothetical protein